MKAVHLTYDEALDLRGKITKMREVLRQHPEMIPDFLKWAAGSNPNFVDRRDYMLHLYETGKVTTIDEILNEWGDPFEVMLASLDEALETAS